MGRYSLIVDNHQDRTIVPTGYLFKKNGKKKLVPATEADFHTESTIYLVRGNTTESIAEVIDTADNIEDLKKSHGQEGQRIKILKRMTLSPGIPQKKLKESKEYRTKKKEVLTDRKVLKEKRQINEYEGDEYYVQSYCLPEQPVQRISSKSPQSQVSPYIMKKKKFAASPNSLTSSFSSPQMITYTPEKIDNNSNIFLLNRIRRDINAIQMDLADIKKNIVRKDVLKEEIEMATTKIIEKIRRTSNYSGVAEIIKTEINKISNTATSGKEKSTRKPDRDGNVEIIPGTKMHLDLYLPAINANSMRRRCTYVLQGIWSKEKRLNLLVQKDKKRPNMDIVTSNDYSKIIDICLELQNSKMVPVYSNNDKIEINVRAWVSDFLKNERNRQNKENAMDE